MKRGAVFDLDGTLLDSMPLWSDAGQRYLASMGVRAEPDLDRRLFSMTTAQGAEYMRRAYALPLSAAEIQDGIHRTVKNFYDCDAALKPGVPAFLRQLRRRGFPLAVATVTDRPLAEAALRRNGVLGLFQAVVTAGEVGFGKDRPDIYRRAAECIGTPPGGTLVFEDALHAVRTANAAGFVTVGVYDASSRDQQDALRRESRYYLSGFTAFAAFAARALI